MNFNVSGTKNVAIGALPVELKNNTSLREALHLLIRGLPETSEVSVEVTGDLGDDQRDHRLTITISTKHVGGGRDERDFTPEEQRENLARKRETYQAEGLTYRDAGRHTTNDKGEETDINALPVARIKDDVSLSDRAEADARKNHTPAVGGDLKRPV